MIKIGGQGLAIQQQVQSLIDDPNLRSTLTLTPKTVTIGSNGGYEENTVTDGTARTVYCIPSNVIKGRTSFQKFGDLKEGEIRFLINYDETIDLNDTVTYNSDVYSIREIKHIEFNEEIIAKSITLSRQLD